MTYLFAYDISDSKRRYKVVKKLKNSGKRLQESIFTVQASIQEKDLLVSEILDLLEISEDSLLVYPVCGKCIDKMEFLGNNQESNKASYLIA